MSTQLLEIQPKELKFIFELKKQSSCSVRLTNNTFHNVAFKVKTTSPKKYCVRPNVGIIMPKSTCEFTVIMQAQKVAPPDMVCKDKFLIQSTVVPLGTTDQDITPNMFAKDDGKYIEEIKLKVAFISPLQSPDLSPINGMFKQGPFSETSVRKDPVLSRVEILTPLHTISKDVEFQTINDQEFNTANDVELKQAKYEELKSPKDAELKPSNVSHSQESKPSNDTELMPNKDMVNGEELKLPNDKGLKLEQVAVSDEQLKPAKDVEFPPVKDVEFTTVKAVDELKLVTDIEEMKSKLNSLELKLNEAESTISKLTEERRLSIQERKVLQEELVMLRSRTTVKKVQVGFPLLFVVMVALISVALGYISHPLM